MATFLQTLQNGVPSHLTNHIKSATSIINLSMLLVYESCPKCFAAYLYFSQNQLEMSMNVPVVNLDVPLATETPWKNTFLAHAQGVFKMFWYGDVRFKKMGCY